MTLLRAGTTLSRDISISGIDALITVDITSAGITLRVKGSRKKVSLCWLEALQAGRTGPEVKSFLMDKPLELIRYEAVKVAKRG